MQIYIFINTVNKCHMNYILLYFGYFIYFCLNFFIKITDDLYEYTV